MSLSYFTVTSVAWDMVKKHLAFFLLELFSGCWLNKVLGFAYWKPRGVVSAKDQCTPAVGGALVPQGQCHKPVLSSFNSSLH